MKSTEITSKEMAANNEKRCKLIAKYCIAGSIRSILLFVLDKNKQF